MSISPLSPRGAQPFSIRRGGYISSDLINQLISAMMRRITTSSLDVRHIGGNVTIELPEQLQLLAESGVSMMRVTAIGDDSLTAVSWDGTNLGTQDFTVAKPPELRKTGVDGVTFTMFRGTFSYAWTSEQERVSTDTSDSSTETQVIVPPYETVFPLNIIFAGTPAGGTNVSGVVLQDMNVAGRAWAEETP